MIFIFVILPFILSQTTSVIRFGEILAKNNYLAIIWRLFLYLANFWTHFVTFLCYSSANFHFAKWPNIEQIISPSVLLISQSILYSSFSHCLASVFLLAHRDYLLHVSSLLFLSFEATTCVLIIAIYHQKSLTASAEDQTQWDCNEAILRAFCCLKPSFSQFSMIISFHRPYHYRSW